MKPPIKGKIIYTLLLLGLTIILGIVWVNKKYNTRKEGLPDSEQLQALGDNISSYANEQLAAAGIVPTSESNAAMSEAIDDMSALIASEGASISDTPYEEATDSSGAVVDTNSPICTDLNKANCTDASVFLGTNQSFLTGATFSSGFCQANNNDPVKLNQQCSRLTSANCNATDCCILLGGKKCVAGNANGPSFTTENGQDIDFTYYSYKNACYGSCGKGKGSAANPCSAYNDTDANVSVQCLNRLWKTTGCPNQTYIGNDTVAV